ncbi:MAG: hypothetical protein K2H12_04545 [Acetatifactor sp.]|nr:hypothetical protein [Acetatifactor sp.]
MEQQYGADPRLMRWIYNNVCGYPQTYGDLKKIKRLDGERSYYAGNNDYDISGFPRWLAEKEGDFTLIGEMTNLQRLRFAKVSINDFSFLSGCQNLRVLDLQKTNFTDCRILAQLPALREVSLPLERKLEHTGILQTLSIAHNLPVKVKVEKPFYRDGDFPNMQIVKAEDIVLSFCGKSEVRCVDICILDKDNSLLSEFPAQQEDNWFHLNQKTKETKIRQLTEAILREQIKSYALSLEPWGEGHYLLADFADGWATLNYMDEENQIFYTAYNAAYDTVEILAPVNMGGQTPTPKMWALDNMPLVAEITRHFLETGQLLPGTQWITGV